jgi:hypothetical protein
VAHLYVAARRWCAPVTPTAKHPPTKTLEYVASYHFSVQVISRGKGRSAIAAAAYRAAARLVDRKTGQVHDYQRKRGVVHTEVLLPKGAAPWLANRERLWNHAHDRETRRDAQLCREINIALPHELDADQRRDLLRTFVMEQFVAKGMVADIAIHAPVPERGQDLRNHHAHVMLTLRQAGCDGLYLTKTRAWNQRDELKTWREAWDQHQNRALSAGRHHDRVDHRSLVEQRRAALEAGDRAKARSLDRLPEIHVGPAAFAMHAQQRRPRALQPPPILPVSPPAPRPFSVAMPPFVPVLPKQNFLLHTVPLGPLATEPRQPPPYEQPQARQSQQPTSTPPPQTRQDVGTPKPFVRDTWRFEIVQRERLRLHRPPKPPIFALTLRETRPRRSWLTKLKPKERLTRLEFNLTRIEQSRIKASAWLRRTQLRQARMMARWRKWRGLLWWLMARTSDPAKVARLFKRMLSDRRVREALAQSVLQAKAEEERLQRRAYDVRVKLQREYRQELRRGRHRSRKR